MYQKTTKLDLLGPPFCWFSDAKRKPAKVYCTVSVECALILEKWGRLRQGTFNHYF